jgi:predicted dehydrogenase
MRMYRTAVIGTGGISLAHARGYAACARTELIAGADIDPDRLAKFGDQTGVSPLYLDSTEMLAKERPEIVSVCTWPEVRREVVEIIAATGDVRAIICEKPIAHSMGAANRICQLCEQAGIKLANMHQRRLVAQHVEARKLLRAGVIGNVVRFWASVTPRYRDPLVWSTHVADMLRFYLGDVEWVMGQIGDIESHAHYHYACPYTAYLKLKSGAVGILEQESGPCQIHLFGDRGQMLVHMDKHEAAPLQILRHDGSGWEFPPLDGYGYETWDAFAGAIGDVVESLEQDRDPWNTGWDGARALEIVLAVYESARRRTRVTLPLETLAYPLDELLGLDSAAV